MILLLCVLAGAAVWSSLLALSLVALAVTGRRPTPQIITPTPCRACPLCATTDPYDDGDGVLFCFGCRATFPLHDLEHKS